ncbi:hypothetical protein [Nocardioides caldifontis]|uniref:hypothetical protein n=1 Tax=Nocardioides caldifontis TaxID=2588938 RepID=UPI0011DFAF33|nr:hypothetical protein [Nocardioides caldifontis]
MVVKVGALHEWTRFLDAHSDDEAVSELYRHIARLNDAHEVVDQVFRRLAFSPGGEVDELVSIARLSLSEAAEMLQCVIERYRAGEHHIA